MMSDYVDLLITSDDVTLDGVAEPLLITDAECITQDIKHLVRDSGLLVEMIGQRDEVLLDDLSQRLELLIEEDERLVPGTVTITAIDSELYMITANTYKYVPISQRVSG